jgi:hypothetical protein
MMTRRVTFFLAAMCLIVARPAGAQSSGQTLTGTWTGVYQSYPNFVRMTLQLSAPAGQAGSAPGELRLEPLVDLRSIAQSPMGVLHVTANYDASSRTLLLTPAPDAYRTLGFQVPQFSGVLDEEKQLVGGVIVNAARDASPYFLLGRAESAEGLFLKKIRGIVESMLPPGAGTRPQVQNPLTGFQNPFRRGRPGQASRVGESTDQSVS